MRRLSGKTALITGGASGFGLAMTKRFSEEGAKVFSVDISDGIFNAIKDVPGEIIPFVANISSPEQVNSMYEACVKELGHLDILCNIAGIGGNIGPMHEMSLDEWKRVFDINVFGHLLVMQGAIKLMLENGKGSIVNMASIGGFRATPGSSAYIASKGANVMMTKQAAMEYVKNGIRVNAVAPGICNTGVIKPKNVSKEDLEQLVEFLESQIPMGRLGEAEEVANLALFLASDEASYITGQVYIIDGGRDAL